MDMNQWTNDANVGCASGWWVLTMCACRAEDGDERYDVPVTGRLDGRFV
jgi:hypothetical protein